MEKRVKRGVAIYSYSGEYGRTMNLEDCFKDMRDMGATGIDKAEITTELTFLSIFAGHLFMFGQFLQQSAGNVAFI